MGDFYDLAPVVAAISGVSAQRSGHCSQLYHNISDINDSTNYDKEWKPIDNMQYVMHIILRVGASTKALESYLLSISVVSITMTKLSKINPPIQYVFLKKIIV